MDDAAHGVLLPRCGFPGRIAGGREERCAQRWCRCSLHGADAGIVLQSAAQPARRLACVCWPTMSPMIEGADARRLRVLTVNIHKGWTAWRGRYMLAELREAIRAVAGDLVLLQEVHGPRDGLEGAQAEYLADTLWRDHAWARNAIVRGASHGNAVLSRWPILRHVNHDVSVPGDEPRGLLHCVLGLPGLDLHAICVHLGLRESHRGRQLQRLGAIVREEVPRDSPLIVAGDFNDWRSRADAALHPAGLREVHCDAHGVHARSFPARWASPTSWPAQSRSDARSAGADTGWCCRAPASRCRRRRCRSPTG